jgi:plasmid stabilization system protein ParE
MTIVVTDSARSDIREILAFFRAPSRASDELSYTFERGIQHLKQWPFTGHLRRDLTKADVCFWFEDPYYFVLQIKEDTLSIVAFLHSARNIPPILRQRLKRKPKQA